MKQIRKRLEWMLDHGQEGTYVTIGCKDCKESHRIMAGTALTAWLSFHETHQVWMKNPFKKRV